MGFIGQLVKKATTRALDIAIERVFPVDRVQSIKSRGSSVLKQKEPERVQVAQARSSPEVTRAMPTVKPEAFSQQDQTPIQAELPWKKPKYQRAEIPELALSTEEILRQEKIRKRRDSKLSREALEREIELEQREIGFSARLLVQATLPHADPVTKKRKPGTPPPTEFERHNGFVTVRIQPLKEFGFPYGTYPRLLMSWITTEAVRTKSPDLVLGDSLAQFMENLGLGRNGGAIARLRNHMQRLFTSAVSATYQDAGRRVDVGFRPVEVAQLFWDPKRPDQTSLWRSTVSLNQRFYQEIIRKPVPLDLGTLKALAKDRSPMALDIYAWLTYRYSYVHEPTLIPWELLSLQFGADYAEEHFFKRKFIAQLSRVKELYADAKFDVTPEGLRLFPSRPHVRLLRA